MLSNALRPALFTALLAAPLTLLAPGAVFALPPESISPERSIPESFPAGRLDSLVGGTLAEGAVAVIFLAAECPLSRAALPALNALAFREKQRDGARVQVLGIVPRETTGSPVLKALRKEQDIRFPLAGDPDLALAKAFGAHVTPEALLLDSAGRVFYRGAVDDRAADLRRKRPRATRAHLDTAVAQWRDGKPAEPMATRAVGCFIE